MVELRFRGPAGIVVALEWRRRTILAETKAEVGKIHSVLDPHEFSTGGYRIRQQPGIRRLVFGLGCFLIAAGVAMIARNVFKYGALSSDDWPIWPSLMLIGIALWLIGLASRTLILRPDGFTTSKFVKRNYLLENFRRFRVDTAQSRYGGIRSYSLEGKPGQPDVVLLPGDPQLYSTQDMELFHSWLKDHFPAGSAHVATNELRAESSMTPGPGHRGLPLQRARVIAWIVNATVVAAAVLSYFAISHGASRPPVIRAIAITSILLLPCVLAVKIWRPSSFQFGSVVGGGAPKSLDLAMLFGAMLPVWIEWQLCQPLRWSATIIPICILSGTLIAITLRYGLERRDRPFGTTGFVVALLVVFGIGAIPIVNAVFDSHPPRRTVALIVGRSFSSGRGGRSYYWKLRFPDEGNFDREIRVPFWLYQEYEVEAKTEIPVPVVLGPGELGVEWIRAVARD